MSATWEKYANDFNAMTDESIASETAAAQHKLDGANDQQTLDEAAGWLEAVAAWEEAGKPRKVMARSHDPARVDEKTTRLALCYRNGRPPIMPGINLDVPEPAPRPSRVRRRAEALALVVCAAAVMYAEGQRDLAPGIGFAIALYLIINAAFVIGGKGNA